ncbi:MAG: DNA-processing protein DprA, partial [Luminiphilus sp.]|nr:DNA-processing protein DprA [Luminiphilus sp.]
NAKSLGKQAALEGMSVISGGAKGVDETATLAALEIEGTAVSVLANDLFKASINRKWQSYLRAGQLALISSVSPETGFQVGNAMGRNKYIYSLSDYAVVVRSDKDSGGTWAGATENLRSNNRWVPLFVPAAPSCEGNSALIDKGARSIDIPEESSAEPADWLTEQLTGSVAKGSAVESQDSLHVSHSAPELMASSRAEIPALETQVTQAPTVSDSSVDTPDATDGYAEFIQCVLEIIESKGEASFSDLLSLRPEKPKTRVRKWVDQAVESGEILRPGRPLRYTMPSRKNVTADLFSDQV